MRVCVFLAFETLAACSKIELPNVRNHIIFNIYLALQIENQDLVRKGRES